MEAKRIFILGISGSGKSTLAKKLSKSLSIRVFDLDNIFWIQKFSEKRDDADCEKELKKLLAREESWIVEGVYDWGKIAADEADLLIWLNYGINVSTYRVLRRWIFSKREKRESILEMYGLIRYLRAYKRVRPNRKYSTYEKHQFVLAGNEHKIVEVKNKKDMSVLLRELGAL